MARVRKRKAVERDIPKQRFSRKDIVFRIPAFLIFTAGLAIYVVEVTSGNCGAQANSISVPGVNFTGPLSGLLITVGFALFGLSILQDVLSVYGHYKRSMRDDV